MMTMMDIHDFKELMEDTSDLVQFVESDGLISYANNAWKKTLGYDEEDLGKIHINEIIAEVDQEHCREIFGRVLLGEPAEGVTAIFSTRDGRPVYVRGNARSRRDAEGHSIGTVGVFRDVTEEKMMLGELRKSVDRFDQLSEQMRVVPWEIDRKGVYTYVGKSVKKVWGYEPDEMINRLHYFDMVPEDVREKHKRENEEFFHRRESMSGYLNPVVTKDGAVLMMSTSGVPILGKEGELKGYQGIDIDVIDLQEKKRIIETLSFRDHLTGVYNRRYIEETILHMEKSIRHHPIALLVVDVNGLKLVNDAFGHEAGDLLLKTVATILQKNCREDDRIGRVGGDEFFVLLSRTGIEEAKKVKRRILELAEEEKFRQIPVSLAIGIGIKETPGDSMDGVRRIADNNMYKNKLKYGRAMRMEVVDTVLQDLYETYPGERLHGEQVALYAGEIAEAMGLGEEDEDEMRMAGHLHDIGKIMVPPEILGKPDTLTMDEMRIVRRHPEIGYQILKSVDVYAPLTVAALSHHEWWDGSGYPEGLKGEEIPLMARIIAVADAYDAMTNRRSGRRSYTEDEAKAELLRRRGSQFDPEVVAAFLSQNPPDKQETKDY